MKYFKPGDKVILDGIKGIIQYGYIINNKTNPNYLDKPYQRVGIILENGIYTERQSKECSIAKNVIPKEWERVQSRSIV